MKVILFDLGNTLEDTEREVLLPGALKTLKTVRDMRDASLPSAPVPSC
jgi:FMN phosphatase YigB (HAD superfamily)